MTPTTLAETILRDVPRHDAYDVMMTLDGHPLPGGCAFGKWVRHADVIAALTAAMDPAIAERAGEVLEGVKAAEAFCRSEECFLQADHFRKAADLITDLLAKNAALRAERDALETERRRAVNEAETLRHYRKSHVDAEERLTAAEAERDALRAERDDAREELADLKAAWNRDNDVIDAQSAQIAALTAKVERLTGAALQQPTTKETGK